MPGEVLALPKERDFIKQILNEPEGAQPAAHEASEGRTHQQKKADEIERQAAAGRGECGLQRTKRAGAERAGAGIAVQSRNAEIFKLSGVNCALGETFDVSVCECGEAELHGQTDVFSQTGGKISQCRCTPDRCAPLWTRPRLLLRGEFRQKSVKFRRQPEELPRCSSFFPLSFLSLLQYVVDDGFPVVFLF